MGDDTESHFRAGDLLRFR